MLDNVAMQQDQKLSSMSVYQSYKLKKRIMKKALFLQYGISIAMFIESLCSTLIPLAFYWEYLLNFFHFLNTTSQLVYAILILIIFNPLKELQEMKQVTRKISNVEI